MKDKYQIYERYPDLLTEQDNTNTLELVNDLDSLYTRSQPPMHLRHRGSQIWHTHSTKRKPRLNWFQPMYRQPYRASRIAIIAALLAIVVLTGSVFAYALEPLLSRVFNMESGSQKVLQDNLFQPIGQSQTINGFTVTLERAYADANRVIIGYTIVKPKGHIYNSTMLSDTSLTTEQGITLRPIDGYGYGNRAGPDATAPSFDASIIQGTPKELHLRFEATGIDVAEQNGPSIKFFQVKSLLAFNFTVVFHAGRVANLHLITTTGGTTETLERVVVTLSEVRVYARGNGTIGELSVSTMSPVSMTTSWQTNDHLTAMSFLTSLFDKYGEWTVHISVDQSVPSTGGGPWIFHFVVP